MKPTPTKNAIFALESKGFFRTDTDHENYFYYYDGKKTSLYARVSHGARELKQREMRGMARTLKLTGHQFEQLLECPMTEEQFKVHAQKILPYLHR